LCEVAMEKGASAAGSTTAGTVESGEFEQSTFKCKSSRDVGKTE